MAESKRKFLLAAKVHADVDVDPVPTAADNAFLAENPSPNFGIGSQQTNEGTGSLNTEAPIITRTPDGIGFRTYAKGAGSAGAAPEFGALFRGAAFEEVILEDPVPAAPEACGAGGTTTTVILGASASSTDQIYRGMPIVLSGTESGTASIIDYDGSTKTATLSRAFAGAIGADTNYQIPANVTYREASEDIDQLAIYHWDDKRLRKFTNMRANALNMVFPTNGAGYFDWNFTGLNIADDDNAGGIPTAAIQANRPAPFNNGALLIDRKEMYASQTSIAMNFQLASPPNPNRPEGFNAPIINSRGPTLTIDPLRSAKADFDPLSLARAGTKVPFLLYMHGAAGNRIMVSSATLQITGYQDSNNQNLATEQLAGFFSGADSALFISIF
ncbi:MAG: hypothetical protein CL484_07575 [Acidobacteria bacterium]|nr:hypothetical protein [Acidobacteriota bacterium]|tara:strand:+ start:219 stop:1379 length:1161 start_codon:yes stop_codon:yes gene_type:complete